MRGELYQTVLIISGVVVAALFGAFLYRELFPEYKIYQNDYVKLEAFRSSYTGEAPPPFALGVKQIISERKDKGPAQVERCTSCHVALEFAHFSPTKIATDSSGHVIADKDGFPKKIKNENYIFAKLAEKVAVLRDSEKNEQLLAEGKQAEVNSRLTEANRLESLKTAQVGEHTYDITKVLAMHPLIGKETRPFEFHPVEEYGCIACHSGNERGLTTEKAHGPVFDGKYETEFMGPIPQFLERDALNDPKFSTIFNHKPGHSLLFQTTPLLVGGLIEAKCVQCHKTSDLALRSADAAPDQPSDPPATIDLLATHYRSGEHLFLSQACYACHRIAGMARGGVGPELTEEGNKYPWFIKESIVWPQADLKTSTMPNFHLDHEELQDLTTFLLAQKGPRKDVSETGHKVTIQEWEGGKKMAWEGPVAPAKMHSLSYGMEVFATQGCAACHRLKGFASDVGFAVEKQKDVNFETLYDEQQWFASLFPEEVAASQLVHTLETHANEIDKRIVNNVRSDSILEKISLSHPGTIEGFYEGFKYAARAKDHQNAIKEAWKERVHRVLMVYIQQYGLGRLIGPRPNWAGVYRTDEWLMEHFKNPSSHVARSIMPILPFDTTKFYALTYMLDILGIRNQQALKKVWEARGFHPQKVYETLCAQCHGPFLEGNGPVSEWIYPIPKNLRNADFLRNLTRERAYQSILHGVKGTPMPAWGEIGSDKLTGKAQPVLSEEEAMQLVDWIYASLPGSTVIRSAQEVPKWQYTPEKIIADLQQEGHLPEGTHDIDPTAYFDSVSPANGSSEKEQCFIKRKYYTPQNLLAGSRIFSLYCADCHGREADGAGIRAGAMTDAKPRMLTNIDWLDSRDDLRLLRSIKYGVAGTPMVAWGDQTNALQRMQLVMYIRSLSETAMLREKLQTALYQTFDNAKQTIEQVRIAKFSNLTLLQQQLNEAQQAQTRLQEEAVQGKVAPHAALVAYQKQLGLLQRVNKLEKVDKILRSIKEEIQQEKEFFFDLGLAFLSQQNNGPLIDQLLALIELQKGSYTVEQGILSFNEAPHERALLIRQAMLEEIDTSIQQLTQEKNWALGKINSSARGEAIEGIDTKVAVLEGLKKRIASSLEQVKQSHVKQNELVEIFKAASPS